MKKYIETVIENFVREVDGKGSLGTKWKKPLVEYVDAEDPYVLGLRELIDENHGLPKEVLPEATVVLVYFVPFTEEIPKANKGMGFASPEWAQLYEETNEMFTKLNRVIIEAITAKGYQAKVSPEATVFDREKIISRWSQRHFAYAAGLGTFGMNNMLITDEGCCGRINSVVTTLPIEAGHHLEEERCLYKANGSCGICFRHCPTQALTKDGFDREKCFKRCLENAEVYNEYGNSYASEAGEEVSNSGSEVCGKCVSNLPCSFRNPVKQGKNQ